jgi:hypothetical protein
MVRRQLACHRITQARVLQTDSHAEGNANVWYGNARFDRKTKSANAVV